MSSAVAGAGGSRRVTVRSISCRGVKAFVPFQKPPLYVALSLAGRREKTNADPDGGENPDWDGAVPLLGNKLVGKVSVPLADLAGGGDGVAPRHVSYQVCAPDGKANGKLSFTYSVTGGGGGAYQQPQPAPNGARQEQDPTSYCAPQPSGEPYPSPTLASYQPMPSLSAPLSYPPPAPAPATTYPPPPSQYISSYPPPPPPPSNYCPPPPAGYPPPTSPMNTEFPALSFTSPTSTYPPPPPDSGSTYPPLPRSAPCFDCSVDRAVPYMSPPKHDTAVAYPHSGAPCYPSPATWQPEEAAGAPYNYYPQPGSRYL
ncbi:hypothetical protein E2562_033629 [Oryza meyeriana var. granulata]|uniref:C2 domain-containing protein n=1 Tax=Oryza meyeriana var. granulata TaxID=110450 RepID=A0A6G1C9B3_9ORYZ|nr:hypothetical protein E2562_033629 [Oryza meyeriana var. granulata]